MRRRSDAYVPRTLVAVVLECALRRVVGPVLDMFASLDEAEEEARRG